MSLMVHIANKLEVHVADHCNMDCVGCSHESPFLDHRFEEVEVLNHTLSKLWNYYQAPCVVLLGGEPLLHPKIDSIVSTVRENTDANIRLRTNGTLLEHRSNEVSEFDEVYVSVYPDANIPDKETLRSIAIESGTPITLHQVSHFRWEHSYPRDNDKLTSRIFDTCKMYHQWDCHTLLDGTFYPCPPSATWETNKEEGINLLEEHTNLGDKIDDILNRDIPFETCKECLGSAGKRLEHKTGWQQSKEEPPAQPVDFEYLRELESDIKAHNGCYEYDRTFHVNGEIEDIER